MSRSRAAPAPSSGVHQASLRANKLDLVECLADDLAHEIKNPLHSMVINLEVLRRRIARSCEADERELARYAGVLASELERVSDRVEMLLQLVRAPRGAEPTTLAATVADLRGLVELERDRRGVEVEYVLPVFGGPGHLSPAVARQLVLNMLLVGLDALGRGGRLVIRVDFDEAHERFVAGGGPLADRPGPVPDSRLTAARHLAEELHGRLEVRCRDADVPPAAPAFELRLLLPTSPA